MTNQSLSLFPYALAAGLIAVLTGCGSKSPEPAAKAPEAVATPDPSAPLAPTENLAHGAKALASSSAEKYPVANLIDGTPEPWGSAETIDDAYAAVALPAPQAVQEIRVQLFSPAVPPRAHLRDVRVVVADADSSKPEWKVVKSRFAKSAAFTEKVTVPVLADNTVVAFEPDHSDPNYGPHKVWGLACYSRSKGDLRNHLQAGAGIYIRELQLK